MPEHLRLEQRLRQGRAVDGHELSAAAAAVVVNELCDELFAGAALAGDKYRRVRRRHTAGELHRAPKGGRGAEDRDQLAVPVGLLELGPDRLRLPGHDHGMGCTPQQDLQVGRRKRLGQIVPGARAQHFEARVDARVPGDHDDYRFRVCFEAQAQQPQSRDLGHVEVQEDDIEPVPLKGLARLLPAAAHSHLVAFVLQHAGAALPQGALVVHDEHADAGLELRRELRETHDLPRRGGSAVSGLRGPVVRDGGAHGSAEPHVSQVRD